MLEQEPPKPHIAKALIVTAPLVALFGWFITGRFHIPPTFAIVIFVVAWILISAIVDSRVKNDWRARYGRSLVSMTKPAKKP